MKEFLLKSDAAKAEVVQDIEFKVLSHSFDNKKDCHYLIFKKGLNLFYKDLLDERSSFERMQLDLDMGIITQILSVNDPEYVQFVYTQAKPLQHFVFTWDLKKNTESQMHTFKPSPKLQYVHITRGVHPRENYFIPDSEDNIYDLRFGFPLNFFCGQEACQGMPKMAFREKLFKKNFEAYA